MDNKRKRRRKINLFYKQNGRCYWCKCQLIDISVKLSGVLPKNYPTLDHLDEKFTDRRGKFNGVERTVLACLDCNSRRSNEFLSKEDKWKMSGRYPLPEYVI